MVGPLIRLPTHSHVISHSQSAVAIVESESNAFERLVNREELKALFLLEGSKLWMQAKVHDVIWNYTDPLMQAIHKYKSALLPVPFIQIQVPLSV